MWNLDQLKAAATAAVWNVDVSALPRWRAALITTVRIGHAVARDLADGQLTLRAMSLVYTTLLSLVPLLAVSFSVLKAFGVHNQVEPLLANVLAPLGEKGVEISTRIIGFVENMKAGVLGSLGLALLIYTVIALIQKIERAFNYTWRIRVPRSFAQRFSDYLSVILIGPVLVFTAVGIMGTLMSSEMVMRISGIQPFGALIHAVGKALPYLLIIAAFAFVYTFVPNTKVHLRSALMGAVVAGVLWETTGWAFASFIVTSTKYTVIYSAFATLIMFMIWLYLGWLILLLGASIAFYHQHPEYLMTHEREVHLSHRSRERLALAIMALVGEHYYHDRPGWTVTALTRRLRIPAVIIESVIAQLESGGLLARTADPQTVWLPARPLDTTPLADVLAAVRGGDDAALFQPRAGTVPAADALAGQVEEALAHALTGRTLKDLALPDAAAHAGTAESHASSATGVRKA